MCLDIIRMLKNAYLCINMPNMHKQTCLNTHKYIELRSNAFKTDMRKSAEVCQEMHTYFESVN